MSFYELQLDPGVDFGSSVSEEYAVDTVETMINRYSTLRHPYVLSRFDLSFSNRETLPFLGSVVDMFHRVGGRANGFRLKHPLDFSSNNYKELPTDLDQICVPINESLGTYQLHRWYGDSSQADCPRRKIKKPVSGSVVVSVDGVSSAFTVDTTTGIITLNTPAVGAVVKAGFYFDVPAVFETDLSGLSIKEIDVLGVNISLVEIRNP